MVELNHRDRTIKVKIVYYGPPVGGKTTNLQILHQAAAASRRGEMISINSAQDRTILFDLLPLKTSGFRGFDLRLQILAVPGQAMYAATRRLVLKGADSLVFVANSAADRWEENLQSYREMTQNLLVHHLDPAAMPLVFQYNKRDLPQVTEIELMDRALNGRKVDTIAAVAVRGEGVLETFSAILMRTIQDLAKRYAILENKDGKPAWQWTQQAVLGMFGTNTLAVETHQAPELPLVKPPPLVVFAVPSVAATAAPPAPPPSPAPLSAPPPAAPPPAGRAATPVATPPAPVAAPARGAPAAPTPSAVPPPPAAPPPAVATPDPVAKAAAPNVAAASPSAPPPAAAPVRPSTPTRSVVRVAPQPEEASRAPGGGPDARANETLVESYAEASAQLGAALTDLREERDVARRHLEDLQKALQAAQDILAGKPLEPVLKPVLGRMADVTGVEQAAFLIAHGTQTLRAACLHGLTQDPLLQVPAAGRYVLEKTAAEPRLHSSADSLDLGLALDAAERSLSALLAVPVRTPRGLQALAIFYYTADAARPSPETLGHLAEISRSLSAALELAATLETVHGAERALEMALAGSASLHGLEDVVTSLVDLRDRMGAIRRRPDAPAWFLEEFARLGPSLAAALSSGRSLLAFSRGEIQREPVLLEDLLSDVRSERVLVKIARGAETVSGDPALLRVAFRALLDHVRGSEGAAEIHVETSGNRVLISVGTPPGNPVAPAPPAVAPGLGLSLARRIAELHGGALSTQTVPGVQDWIVLSLLPR